MGPKCGNFDGRCLFQVTLKKWTLSNHKTNQKTFNEIVHLLAYKCLCIMAWPRAYACV